MNKHWQYLKYIIRHKKYVFIAGRVLKVSIWRLIIHDWSKFLPSEWKAYADYFYGVTKENYIKARITVELNKGSCNSATAKGIADYNWDKIYDNREFDFNDAWLFHQRRNKHHWQYWLLINDSGVTLTMADRDTLEAENTYRYFKNEIALPIPNVYVREMVADWFGAGRAITGKWEGKEWYENNKYNMIINDKSYVNHLVNRVHFKLNPNKKQGN